MNNITKSKKIASFIEIIIMYSIFTYIAIKTYSKLETKINEIIQFIKKEIEFGNQIFWVCPLIEESKKIY